MIKSYIAVKKPETVRYLPFHEFVEIYKKDGNLARYDERITESQEDTHAAEYQFDVLTKSGWDTFGENEVLIYGEDGYAVLPYKEFYRIYEEKLWTSIKY